MKCKICKEKMSLFNWWLWLGKCKYCTGAEEMIRSQINEKIRQKEQESYLEKVEEHKQYFTN